MRFHTFLHARWPGQRSIVQARRGVAALEFALTAPVLIFMLMGMFDLSRGWIAQRQLTTSAFSVGQIATILAVQSDNTNVLHGDDAWRAATAINAAMPSTRIQGADYSVSLAEVSFTTDNTCTTPQYCIGKVRWTINVLPGNRPDLARGCPIINTQAGTDGRLGISDDTNPPDRSYLPRDVFTQAPVMIVDVTYNFTPLFLGSVIGQIPMRWMAAFGARSGNSSTMLDQFTTYVDATNPAGSLVTQCP